MSKTSSLIYELRQDSLDEIDFAPSSTLKEILQNVKTVLTTVKGSVPLDRAFGLTPEGILDAPIPVAQTKLMGEIVDALRDYEPRVSVKSVSFDGDGLDGKLIPTVKVAIKSE